MVVKHPIASGRPLFTLPDGRFFGALTERVIPNDIIPSDPMRNAVTKMSETDEELVARLRQLVDDQEGGDAVVLVQRQLFNRVVGRLARRATPAPEPQPEVAADLIERLREILEDDAPNKWVWKTHQSQDEWLREKILPLLRDIRPVLATPPVVEEAVKAETDPAKRFAEWQHEGEALAAAAGCSFVLKVKSPRSTWTITTPPARSATP